MDCSTSLSSLGFCELVRAEEVRNRPQQLLILMLRKRLRGEIVWNLATVGRDCGLVVAVVESGVLEIVRVLCV